MGQKLLDQPRGGGEVDIENPLSVSHGGRHPGSVRQCASAPILRVQSDEMIHAM